MTQKTVRLENWSIVRSFGLFANSIDVLGSEDKIGLSGYVYGHPDFDDGDGPIHTTRIIMTNGKKAITRNTQYILGEVDPEYDKWMQENHPEDWDPENPKFGD